MQPIKPIKTFHHLHPYVMVQNTVCMPEFIDDFLQLISTKNSLHQKTQLIF